MLFDWLVVFFLPTGSVAPKTDEKLLSDTNAFVCVAGAKIKGQKSNNWLIWVREKKMAHFDVYQLAAAQQEQDYQTYLQTDFPIVVDHRTPLNLVAGRRQLLGQTNQQYFLSLLLVMTKMDYLQLLMHLQLVMILFAAWERAREKLNWKTIQCYEKSFKRYTLYWFMAASSSARACCLIVSSIPFAYWSLRDAAPNPELQIILMNISNVAK